MSCAYPRLWFASMFLGVVAMAFWSDALSMSAEPMKTKPETEAKPAAKPSDATAKTPWKSLFDGKTLDGWRIPDLGTKAKPVVKDGTIVLPMGTPMSGITWAGDVIRNNYELTLEGMRIEGSDFFCTTTFPVGKDPCTLVVGGWGGSLVGLSNVDHFDASENPTTTTMEFKDKQWYRIRIRVSDSAIQAWIDDQMKVNQARKDHVFSIRIEVTDCVPLGVSTWYTSGAVRNIRVRPLAEAEVQTAAEELKKSNKDF